MEQHTTSSSRPRSRGHGRSCSDVEQLARVDHIGARGHAARRRAAGSGARARIDQPRIPTTVWTVTDLTVGRDFTWQASSPGRRTTGRAHRRGDRAGHLPGHPLDHPVGRLGSVVGRGLPVASPTATSPWRPPASRRAPSRRTLTGDRLGPRRRRGPGWPVTRGRDVARREPGQPGGEVVGLGGVGRLEHGAARRRTR